MYMPEYYDELDKEEAQRIADYFDPWDLVEHLGLTTEEIVEAFKDKVQEKIEELEEIMGISHE